MKTRFCLFFVVALGFAFNTSVTGIDAVITNCGPVAGGFLLEWIPVGEADVLWTPDLVMPFTNLSITLPSGQGSYTDTVHGADNQCYYRVDLYPPEGMVLIPGGMNSGINPLAPGESYDPAERVEYPSNYAWAVSSFYMDQTEVPKGKWDEVYNWATNNSYVFERDALGKAADHPVHTVNWYNCVKWCNARSQMENKTPCYTIDGNIYKTGQITIPDCSFNANGYRLPTSGEWEYAARGGCFSRRFPWGDTISHDDANYKANGAAFSYDTSPYTTDTYHTSYDHGNLPYTSPVGSFAANDYGLYDMTGNVSEWCWGAGDDFDYNRLARGGCWYDLANDCRVGRSHMLGAGSWGVFLGFRTVISAE